MEKLRIYIKYILVIGVILAIVATVQYNIAATGETRGYVILPMLASIAFGILFGKISILAKEQKEKNEILKQRKRDRKAKS